MQALGPPPNESQQTVILRAQPATVIAGPQRISIRPQANAFDVRTQIIRAPAPVAGDDRTQVFSQVRKAKSEEEPLPAGTVLNGRYEILKTIGRGGFAYVYLCQHVRNGRLNAIKEAYGEDWSRYGTRMIVREPVRNALLREISAISRVSHPGIVRLEHVFEENDTIYFAMDFVEGETLSNLLSRRNGVSDLTFRQLSDSLLDAVGHLHNNDVLHGDIKPANIVIRPDRSIALIDFGSAERLSDMHYETPTVSVGYSANERYREHGEVGAWSDVYSCAATLAAALAGRPPPPAPDISDDASRLSSFLEEIASNSPDRQKWRDEMADALVPAVEGRTSSITSLRQAMGFAPAQRTAGSAPRSVDGHSVFVSYSRRDARLVEAQVKALQLRGVGVWIDRQGIQPGSAAWGGDIVRAMRDAQVVLVFSSRDSMASENVIREIYQAERLRKKMIVVLLDESPFHDDVSIFLTPIQHLRVDPADSAALIDAVVDALERMSAAPAG